MNNKEKQFMQDGVWIIIMTGVFFLYPHEASNTEIMLKLIAIVSVTLLWIYLQFNKKYKRKI